MAIVILLVRNGSSKCKHPSISNSLITFSITFRIQTVIIIRRRNSPKPQWSKDQSVGSYCSLLLTACSNMALRYVWQTLHVLTCSYNELSDVFECTYLDLFLCVGIHRQITQLRKLSLWVPIKVSNLYISLSDIGKDSTLPFIHEGHVSTLPRKLRYDAHQ